MSPCERACKLNAVPNQGLRYRPIMRILDGRTLSEGTPVRRETLHWLAAPDYQPEASKDSLLPLLVLPEGCSLQRFVRSTLDKNRARYVVAHSASGVAGLQSALVVGLGVTCLNSSAVPKGTEVCRTNPALPSLPQVEVSLLPPRPVEAAFVTSVREMLATQFARP